MAAAEVIWYHHLAAGQLWSQRRAFLQERLEQAGDDSTAERLRALIQLADLEVEKAREAREFSHDMRELLRDDHA